jgi:hypothetical protein
MQKLVTVMLMLLRRLCLDVLSSVLLCGASFSSVLSMSALKRQY